METTQIMTILKNSAVFGHLEDSMLDTLVFLGYPKRLAAGEAIYQKGEPSNERFGIVLSGRIQALKKDDAFFKELGVGEVIGEIALSEPHHKRTMTLQAAVDAEVLEWDVNHVKQQIPGVWRKLLKLAWEHLAEYSEDID